MELWIRSQDKTNLYKISNINIDKDDYTLYCQLEWGQTFLGTYKTKERALEILDEIQNILNLKDMYKYDRELVLNGWKNVNKEQVKIVRQQMSVYEMPEE